MLLWAVPGRDDGLKPLAISQAEVNFDAGPHPSSFARARTDGNPLLAPAHSRYLSLRGRAPSATLARRPPAGPKFPLLRRNDSLRANLRPDAPEHFQDLEGSHHLASSPQHARTAAEGRIGLPN